MTPDDTASATPPPQVAPQLADPALLDALQHEVAVFARRAEQTRLAGSGPAKGAMDRAAYLLLSRLDQNGPTGVKALAAGMGIDSSTVTRQVAPLVEAGLVLRDADPDDGRAVVLRLSESGSARLEEVRASRRQLMALLTEDWTPQQRDEFRALLTRFNAAIGDWQTAPATGRAPVATDSDRPPA
ncbi:MarR family winged helix-turn-helix transcriptional regulator [Streptomyces avicenniae]|uniref:MarR family winged helix-turn-helix transcriptional regulator n=1 Tax=Streptomyces avicenniae TaxID=500153 RepID=UPI000699A827|nr:MarR family winged helix-turn-helix transcriptional regulator [Streptomyces avicenniae]